MATTDNGLPYPTMVQAPDVPYWLQQLAEALDPHVADIPGAYLRADEAQNVDNATVTTLVWDVTEHLRGGMTLGSSGVIVPRAGWYAVDASARWASNASGSRQLRIMQNGTVRCAGVEIPNATGGFSHTVSHTLYCDVGDELSTMVYQSSGGVLATSPNFGMPYLSVVRVGR